MKRSDLSKEGRKGRGGSETGSSRCGDREAWKVKGSPLRTKRSGPQGVLWKVFLVIPPEVKARAAHEGLSPAQQAWTLTVWG